MRQKHCSNIIQMFTNINRGRGLGLVTCQVSGQHCPTTVLAVTVDMFTNIKEGGGSGYA